MVLNRISVNRFLFFVNKRLFSYCYSFLVENDVKSTADTRYVKMTYITSIKNLRKLKKTWKKNKFKIFANSKDWLSSMLF